MPTHAEEMDAQERANAAANARDRILRALASSVRDQEREELAAEARKLLGPEPATIEVEERRRVMVRKHDDGRGYLEIEDNRGDGAYVFFTAQQAGAIAEALLDAARAIP